MEGQNRAARPRKVSIEVTETWINFIRHCDRLRFGELARLQIQDGAPVSAECVKKKVKFTAPSDEESRGGAGSKS